MRAAAIAVIAVCCCSGHCGIESTSHTYARAVDYVQDGFVRSRVDPPVSYQLRMLWRLDQHGAWRPAPIPDRSLRALALPPTKVALPLGLGEGFYFAVAAIAGHTECAPFLVSEKKCNDVMLAWPSPRGQIPVCLPGGRASFVPDPFELTLPDGRGVRALCGNNGYLLEESTFKSGALHGPYRTYDVNGRVTGSAMYRDGEVIGTAVHEEGVTRYETPYVDGRPHGTQRGFDAAGRLTHKNEFVNGVETRTETFHPSGTLASRTTLRSGGESDTEAYYPDGAVAYRSVMRGDLGSTVSYRPDGTKLSEQRIVVTGSSAAHQCVAVYDVEGRARPCPGTTNAPTPPGAEHPSPPSP
jgi:antitoxin component YwqK of YwqJK toxin-antitoxin module